MSGSKRDNKGRFIKGSSMGRPAGGVSNKKLVSKLKTAMANAIKEYLREEKAEAAQLEMFLEGRKDNSIVGVYVIEGDKNRYRIGASSNLHSRISQHKTNNLIEVSVFCTFPTNTIDEANMLEAVLHERLEPMSLGNSWYELDESNLLSMVRYANSIIYGEK